MKIDILITKMCMTVNLHFPYMHLTTRRQEVAIEMAD